MQASKPEGPRHIPALDGLRGVAVLLVLFFHLTTFGRLSFLSKRVSGVESAVASWIAHVAMSAWVGVDLFFVLSGYLITTILLREKGHPRFYGRFYARRAARILPLYYALLAGYAAVVFLFGSHDKLRALGWPLLFATNIALGLHGDSAIPHELQHLWSLAIEEQFYLLFPLLVALVSRAVLGWVSVLGVLVALVFRIVIRPNLPLASFLTPARFDGLLVGALVAVVLTPSLLAAGSPVTLRWTRTTLALSASVLGAFLVWRGSLAGKDVVVDIYGRTPLNAFFGAVVAATVMLPRSVLVRVLSAAPLRFFGRYSYAMYMLHVPVLAGLFALRLDVARFAVATGSLLVGYALFALLVTSATVAGALVSYYLLERHFLALRNRLRSSAG